jgi:hypothetical protein
MDGKALPGVVTVAFSAVGVLADYFLKRASAQDAPFRSPACYVGFAVYAATAFGTIGVLYSVSMILLLTTVGIVAFGEKLSYPEVAGLLLALASLVLLVRFA